MTIRAVVKGVGHYLPERLVPNSELESLVETSDEWIRSRSGIERRHFAADGQTTSDLAIRAAKAALADAGIEADQIDAIILATSTADLTFPSAATMIQAGLGMTRGFAFDVQAVCAGFAFALTAYLLWGFLPLYMKALSHIPTLEVLAHRVIWSVPIALVILAIIGRTAELKTALRTPRLLAMGAVTAGLISINWGIYVWSIQTGHALEAALGYYINPLLNVLLGMFFLGERLRKFQWLALSLATTGVVIQLVTFGSVPWIALTLACTFALYGLFRKKLAIDAITGLFIESLLLLPLALYYWWQFADSSAADLSQNSWSLNLWLIAAGFVTTVPLLLFIAAAKRLQLSTMGFFQYIGPSFMFVFGVWLYNETLTTAKLVTFGFIWLALIVYSLDAYLALRKKPAVQVIE